MEFLATCVLSTGVFLHSCSSPSNSAQPAAALVLPSDLLSASMRDMNGKTLVIADKLAGGNRVALVFWQAGCSPCRAEAPHLAAASRAYSNLEIIGVVSGPDESVDAVLLEKTIAELSLPYPTVRDRSLDLTRALDVRGTPTIVVLGAKGQVLYQGHKSPDWKALL